MNSIDLDKENIKLLQQLNETSLKLCFIKPLFEMKGWEVVDVHGDSEEDTGVEPPSGKSEPRPSGIS